MNKPLHVVTPASATASGAAPTPATAPGAAPASATAPGVTPASATAPGTAPAPDAAAADVATLLAESGARHWYQRTALWAGLLAVLVVAAGLWWWQSTRAANAAPSYTTQPVAAGNLTLSVTANGTLQPTRSIAIGSELSGTVLKVNVDVNDSVKKGQVLVVLDTAKLRDQILRAQASVAAANGKLTQTTATLQEAQAGQARLEEVARLSGGQVPSKLELDGGRATVARARADQASARAGVQDAQAALSTDQINLSKASIVSPADGLVLTRSVDPGNAVAASLQAVTLFTVAEDLAKLRLWVYVDEADVGSVKVGQEASFTVSAYPNRPYPARTTRVGFGSTITDNVVTYLTHLDVDNADLSLRPGMTASATIIANQRTNVLLVPNAALRFSPSTAVAPEPAKQSITSALVPRVPGRGGGGRRQASASAGAAEPAATRQVWVLPGDGSDGPGTPVAVAVTTGISDGRMTEVLSGELKPGMRVVTDQKRSAAR